MKRLVLFLVLFFILMPTILALESCESRKICFNVEQQNCLFLMFLPYDFIMIAAYLLIYFVFRKKIKHQGLKKNVILGLSAFLLFVLLALVLGKLFIFQRCGI